MNEEINYKENEVVVFDKETVKKLLKEGYTQQEIDEAKAQTKRLMEQLDIKNTKEAIQEAKNKNHKESGISFIEAYNSLDFSKKYNSDETSQLRNACQNQEEGSVLSSLIHINNSRLEGARKDDFYVGLCVKYLKSVIVNYDLFNSFSISKECADIIKETIDCWTSPKNESKKIKIKITNTMPQKKLKKYGIEPGSVFASQKDLAEFCGVTVQRISIWKKAHYIDVA